MNVRALHPAESQADDEGVVARIACEEGLAVSTRGLQPGAPA